MESLALFCAGRPLWLGMLTEYLTEPENDARRDPRANLVNFAATKLLNGAISFNYDADAKVQLKLQQLAAFHARFGFSAISTELSEELSTKYMATLCAVSEDMQVCSVHYPVEPLLAEVSCIATRGDSAMMVDMISAVGQQIHKDREIEASVGDCGELTGAVAVSCAMDQLRSHATYNATHNNMSREVPVLDFLDVLIGAHRCSELQSSNPSLYTQLGDFSVNFTNITRLAHLNEAIVQLAYTSRTAFVLRQNCPCADVLLIMRNKKHQYSYLLLQIKNYRNEIGFTDADYILGNLHPAACGLMHIKCLANAPCSVALLITVGEKAAVEITRCNCIGRSTRTSSPKITQFQATVALQNMRLDKTITAELAKLARPYSVPNPRGPGAFSEQTVRALIDPSEPPTFSNEEDRVRQAVLEFDVREKENQKRKRRSGEGSSAGGFSSKKSKDEHNETADS